MVECIWCHRLYEVKDGSPSFCSDLCQEEFEEELAVSEEMTLEEEIPWEGPLHPGWYPDPNEPRFTSSEELLRRYGP